MPTLSWPTVCGSARSCSISSPGCQAVVHAPSPARVFCPFRPRSMSAHATAAAQQQPAPSPAAMTTPLARVMGAAQAFMQTQAVYAAAKLGLADALLAGPLPCAELAAAVGARADHLKRMLRLLTLLGIFEEKSPGMYANNDASVLLSSSSPASRRDMVMHMGGSCYMGWAKMPDSMLPTNPETAFLIASGGLSYWEWMNLPEHHEDSTHFNRAMTENSKAALPAILKEYDWSQHASATVADVGGGEGLVLSALLQQHPGMQGILFDRPPVIEEAVELWGRQPAELQGRVELQGGDFFEAAPQADVYFLKHILHDWSDGESIKILQTLRRAAPPACRVLLYEAAIPDGQPWEMGKACMDLQMMVMAGGKERSVGEWRSLLAAGGFELEEVVPLSTGFSIVAARPV